MNNRILILGTGQAQADAIRMLKEKGFRVYACSYTAGDAGEKHADEFEQINIVDVEAVLQYVRDNDINYVYSVGSDIAMPTACEVSKKAGLPSFVSERAAQICNTKSVLRQTLGRDFVGNVPFCVLSSPEEMEDLSYPVVIKPVDSQGQRGVFTINSKEELEEKFQNSLSFSRLKKVIAEEFVDGDEISVNTFSVDGTIVFKLISDRLVWEQFPGGLIRGHIIPSKYQEDSALVAKVYDLVERVQDKLEINNGPAYFQIKINSEREPRLIEVTPRLDGCHMWRLIRHATGIDLLDMTFALLAGEEISFDEDYEVRPVETTFFCLPPGEVFSKEGFDTEATEYLQWYYEDDDSVKKMNGFMEKCGYRISAI